MLPDSLQASGNSFQFILMFTARGGFKRVHSLKEKKTDDFDTDYAELSHRSFHLPQDGIAKIQIIDTGKERMKETSFEGIGISEENINKLFQPFVQAEASTSQ